LIDWLFTVLRPNQEYFTYEYEDVTITSEGLQNLGLHAWCSRPFEQEGIFIVPHLLWHGTSVFPVSSEGLPHSVALRHTRGCGGPILTQILTGQSLWKLIAKIYISIYNLQQVRPIVWMRPIYYFFFYKQVLQPILQSGLWSEKYSTWNNNQLNLYHCIPNKQSKELQFKCFPWCLRILLFKK
jgi:hypothetical protein